MGEMKLVHGLEETRAGIAQRFTEPDTMPIHYLLSNHGPGDRDKFDTAIGILAVTAKAAGEKEISVFNTIDKPEWIVAGSVADGAWNFLQGYFV